MKVVRKDFHAEALADIDKNLADLPGAYYARCFSVQVKAGKAA